MPCKAAKLDVSLFWMKKSVAEDVSRVIKSGCASPFCYLAIIALSIHFIEVFCLCFDNEKRCESVVKL